MVLCESTVGVLITPVRNRQESGIFLNPPYMSTKFNYYSMHPELMVSIIVVFLYCTSPFAEIVNLVILYSCQ